MNEISGEREMKTPPSSPVLEETIEPFLEIESNVDKIYHEFERDNDPFNFNKMLQHQMFQEKDPLNLEIAQLTKRMKIKLKINKPTPLGIQKLRKSLRKKLTIYIQSEDISFEL